MGHKNVTECFYTHTHKSIYELRMFTALLCDGFMRIAFRRNPIIKGMVRQKHLDSSLIVNQLSKCIGESSPIGNTVLMEDWPNNTLSFFFSPQSSSTWVQESAWYSFYFYFYTVYIEREVKVWHSVKILQLQKRQKSLLALLNRFLSYKFYRNNEIKACLHCPTFLIIKSFVLVNCFCPLKLKYSVSVFHFEFQDNF